MSEPASEVPSRRRAAPPADSARNPLTREQWIDAAMALLIDGGVDLVRVDVLARQLGVTRGSFYWHFKDRGDLLAQVLRAWRDAATEHVTFRFDGRHDDPEALIRNLATLPLRGQSAARAARVELAIRDWARRDPMAQEAVDEADGSRIAYLAQCFAALGFGAAEARHRAGVLYAYQVGESLLARQGSAAHRSGRNAVAAELLLAPRRAAD
jgi:AcrR family transcriptional regulator